MKLSQVEQLTKIKGYITQTQLQTLESFLTKYEELMFFNTSFIDNKLTSQSPIQNSNQVTQPFNNLLNDQNYKSLILKLQEKTGVKLDSACKLVAMFLETQDESPSLEEFYYLLMKVQSSLILMFYSTSLEENQDSNIKQFSINMAHKIELKLTKEKSSQFLNLIMKFEHFILSLNDIYYMPDHENKKTTIDSETSIRTYCYKDIIYETLKCILLMIDNKHYFENQIILLIKCLSKIKIYNNTFTNTGDKNSKLEHNINGLVAQITFKILECLSLNLGETNFKNEIMKTIEEKNINKIVYVIIYLYKFETMKLTNPNKIVYLKDTKNELIETLMLIKDSESKYKLALNYIKSTYLTLQNMKLVTQLIIDLLLQSENKITREKRIEALIKVELSNETNTLFKQYEQKFFPLYLLDSNIMNLINFLLLSEQGLKFVYVYSKSIKTYHRDLSIKNQFNISSYEIQVLNSIENETDYPILNSNITHIKKLKIITYEVKTNLIKLIVSRILEIDFNISPENDSETRNTYYVQQSLYCMMFVLNVLIISLKKGANYDIIHKDQILDLQLKIDKTIKQLENHKNIHLKFVSFLLKTVLNNVDKIKNITALIKDNENDFIQNLQYIIKCYSNDKEDYCSKIIIETVLNLMMEIVNHKTYDIDDNVVTNYLKTNVEIILLITNTILSNFSDFKSSKNIYLIDFIHNIKNIFLIHNCFYINDYLEYETPLNYPKIILSICDTIKSGHVSHVAWNSVFVYVQRYLNTILLFTTYNTHINITNEVKTLVSEITSVVLNQLDHSLHRNFLTYLIDISNTLLKIIAIDYQKNKNSTLISNNSYYSKNIRNIKVGIIGDLILNEMILTDENLKSSTLSLFYSLYNLVFLKPNHNIIETQLFTGNNHTFVFAIHKYLKTLICNIDVYLSNETQILNILKAIEILNFIYSSHHSKLLGKIALYFESNNIGSFFIQISKIIPNPHRFSQNNNYSIILDINKIYVKILTTNILIQQTKSKNMAFDQMTLYYLDKNLIFETSSIDNIICYIDSLNSNKIIISNKNNNEIFHLISMLLNSRHRKSKHDEKEILIEVLENKIDCLKVTCLVVLENLKSIYNFCKNISTLLGKNDKITTQYIDTKSNLIFTTRIILKFLKVQTSNSEYYFIHNKFGHLFIQFLNLFESHLDSNVLIEGVQTITQNIINSINITYAMSDKKDLFFSLLKLLSWLHIDSLNISCQYGLETKKKIEELLKNSASEMIKYLDVKLLTKFHKEDKVFSDQSQITTDNNHYHDNGYCFMFNDFIILFDEINVFNQTNNSTIFELVDIFLTCFENLVKTFDKEMNKEANRSYELLNNIIISFSRKIKYFSIYVKHNLSLKYEQVLAIFDSVNSIISSINTNQLETKIDLNNILIFYLNSLEVLKSFICNPSQNLTKYSKCLTLKHSKLIQKINIILFEEYHVLSVERLLKNFSYMPTSVSLINEYTKLLIKTRQKLGSSIKFHDYNSQEIFIQLLSKVCAHFVHDYYKFKNLLNVNEQKKNIVEGTNIIYSYIECISSISICLVSHILSRPVDHNSLDSTEFKDDEFLVESNLKRRIYIHEDSYIINQSINKINQLHDMMKNNNNIVTIKELLKPLKVVAKYLDCNINKILVGGSHLIDQLKEFNSLSLNDQKTN